jgi:4-oxalocrotonate tautomerase
MPVVTIDMWEGRTIEQKRRLVEGVTAAIMSSLNVSAETVQIIIKDNPKHNWGIAGKLASEQSP